MIVDLPSATTSDVAKKLVRLRADTGSMALSRVLTLLVVVDEEDADAAIETANDASRQHPCRIIVVVAGNKRGAARLDGQIRLGGDAGASEVVVLGRSTITGVPNQYRSRVPRSAWAERARDPRSAWANCLGW